MFALKYSLLLSLLLLLLIIKSQAQDYTDYSDKMEVISDPDSSKAVKTIGAEIKETKKFLNITTKLFPNLMHKFPAMIAEDFENVFETGEKKFLENAKSVGNSAAIPDVMVTTLTIYVCCFIVYFAY